MTGRGPPNIKGLTSLKVDNLTYKTQPEDLRRAFEKFGEIGDVYIPKDKNKGNTKGFAFVRFYDRGDAEDALEGMDGRPLDGRDLKIAMATQSLTASLAQQRNRTRSRGLSRSTSRSPSTSKSGSEAEEDTVNHPGTSMEGTDTMETETS